MDKLIAGLCDAAHAAAQARERISTDQNAGSTPNPLDREVLNAWLTAATTLATLICTWPHPHLKAKGAQLHYLAEHISKTIDDTASLP